LLAVAVRAGDFSCTASPDTQFAAAVAAFGMNLRDSKHRGSANLGAVHEWARNGQNTARNEYRNDFIHLVERAAALRPRE